MRNAMNLLLATDCYKMGHMQQYAPGTSKIYSYLQARKPDENLIFFGLQYYLKKYLQQPITQNDVEEFMDISNGLLGATSNDVYNKLKNLQALGYLPIRIKAVPEGSIIPSKNVLLTMTNTVPGYHWVVGLFESLLLKLWYPITVATYSKQLKEIVNIYSNTTCDSQDLVPFQVHDFGYRGVSSEETAAIGGAAHLVNFEGTDTVPAVKFIKDYYHTPNVGKSVPASEHSVMCSFGEAGELAAFRHMLETYPTGIVSIVADTYNIWRVLGEYIPKLKSAILNRPGKVVIRPDSGDQYKILLGNPSGQNIEERLGVFESLALSLGSYKNSKGYEVLHPNVGVIYGEGFTKDRMTHVLGGMQQQGWATDNLVMGIGGLLLQNHSRDEFGFAIKATYAEINNTPTNIYKDPITDPGKKSHTGLLRLVKRPAGHGWYYTTEDNLTWEQESTGELLTVFEDGKILRETNFEEIRKIRNLTSYK